MLQYAARVSLAQIEEPSPGSSQALQIVHVVARLGAGQMVAALEGALAVVHQRLNRDPRRPIRSWAGRQIVRRVSVPLWVAMVVVEVVLLQGGDGEVLWVPPFYPARRN